MDRTQAIAALRDGGTWDIVIIGGGATGLGTAVDAASRGYRTALIEQHDFAKGTSSRSTKLVHGGIRYLEQFQWRLVFEALHERNRVMRNAPHLTAWQPFVVPCYSHFDRVYFWGGLKFYDALAGRHGHGPTRWLGARTVREAAPTLRVQRVTTGSAARTLRGGIQYYDGQFDDARLALALARTAAEHGATVANYVRAVELIHDRGRAVGLLVEDGETGSRWEIRARVLVNATGIFTDTIRELDTRGAVPLLRFSQGVHLVFHSERLPARSAIVVPRTDDGRVLFAIPWYGHVLLGTTDTPIDGAELEPRPLDTEIDFLLRHAREYFESRLELDDVRSVFVGVRPLLRRGSDVATRNLSRGHAIFTAPSGLVSVTGGKWTTYRHMAEEAVDRAAEVGRLEVRPCRTRDLPLHGAPEHAEVDDPLLAELQWPTVYGTDAPAVELLVAERPEWGERLHAAFPYRVVDVVWAVRHEMARTVEDVLARRTRALLLDARASLEAAPHVARVMAEQLGRDAQWQTEQLEAYRALARNYMLA